MCSFCVFVVVAVIGCVWFRNLYFMWVALLKSLECGCLSTIGLQRDEEEDHDDDDDENHG